MNLLGGMLILLGFGGIGWGAFAMLSRRIFIMKAMVQALSHIQRELAFHLTSLPLLFGSLSQTLDAPVNLFFGTLSAGTKEMAEHSMGELWQRGVAQLEGKQGDLHPILSLGQVLGCYDVEHQCQAILQAKIELEESVKKLEGERQKARKLYGTLSLGLGGLTVIMLL